MEFWIFMLAMGLLFSVVMILFGTMVMKSAPKKINYIFGYFVRPIFNGTLAARLHISASAVQRLYLPVQ